MKWLNWTLAIVLLLSPLALLEVSSRWWIVRYADPLQRARRILTLDDELGWIARSNLNLMFEGKRLFTDTRGLRVPSNVKNDLDTKQILVLGPSSAFGWGVNCEEAWPALIDGNTVLNASQVGYSIVQGQKLYERLRADGLSGIKTVIIAYGVNDIDHFRFFDQTNLSDVEYFKQMGKNELLGGIYASGILSTLARGYQEAAIYFHCGYPQRPMQRVGAEAFSMHLKGLILELRKNKIGVLLVNSANAINVEPNNSKAEESDRLYEESARASALNQCARSRDLFFQAKKFESWRVIRDIDRINLAIQKTGTEMNVPVANISGLEQKSFFVDPIHFSAEGHRLVADVIKSALMELN